MIVSSAKHKGIYAVKQKTLWSSMPPRNKCCNIIEQTPQGISYKQSANIGDKAFLSVFQLLNVKVPGNRKEERNAKPLDRVCNQEWYICICKCRPCVDRNDHNSTNITKNVHRIISGFYKIVLHALPPLSRLQHDQKLCPSLVYDIIIYFKKQVNFLWQRTIRHSKKDFRFMPEVLNSHYGIHFFAGLVFSYLYRNTPAKATSANTKISGIALRRSMATIKKENAATSQQMQPIK